jgi:hypothetical protein
MDVGSVGGKGEILGEGRGIRGKGVFGRKT